MNISGSCRSAISQACNVTVWDDQVALFDLAVKTYGGVDIVVSLCSSPSFIFIVNNTFYQQIANAGAMDTPWLPVKQEDGKLGPPKVNTLDVNVTGTLYSKELSSRHLISYSEMDQLAALLCTI
jgi:hypothetical protein